MDIKDLSEDEKKLIRFYRISDNRGKQTIQKTAKYEAEESDRERFKSVFRKVK